MPCRTTCPWRSPPIPVSCRHGIACRHSGCRATATGRGAVRAGCDPGGHGSPCSSASACGRRRTGRPCRRQHAGGVWGDRIRRRCGSACTARCPRRAVSASAARGSPCRSRRADASCSAGTSPRHRPLRAAGRRHGSWAPSACARRWLSSSGAPTLRSSLSVERRAWQAAQVFMPAGSAGLSRTAKRASLAGNFHASFQRLFSAGRPLSPCAV